MRLERLAGYDFAAVVVEASLLDVRAKCYRSKVPPAVIVASAASIAVRYGVHVYFAGDRVKLGRLLPPAAEVVLEAPHAGGGVTLAIVLGAVVWPVGAFLLWRWVGLVR